MGKERRVEDRKGKEATEQGVKGTEGRGERKREGRDFGVVADEQKASFATSFYSL